VLSLQNGNRDEEGRKKKVVCQGTNGKGKEGASLRAERGIQEGEKRKLLKKYLEKTGSSEKGATVRCDFYGGGKRGLLEERNEKKEEKN